MVTLGEELKREREYREISLREISEATKINIRMLEAIENDNYSILPGGIFNRNFIRAYAEFIGLDPEIAVRKYLVQAAQQPASETPAALAISLMAPGKPTILGISKGLFFLLMAVLLAALVISGLWFFGMRMPLPEWLVQPESKQLSSHV
jgi:cytoskeletal protein RodZ